MVPRLMAAGGLLLTALVPRVEDARAVSELLRQAAVVAGCEAPSVAMRWLGQEHGIEIDVRCPVRPVPTAEVLRKGDHR